MKSVRRAVIDVGTNSIKLLVADVTGREVSPLLEDSRQTRLGRGFYQDHRLQPSAIAGTAEAVAEFSNIARQQSAVSIRVVATSAARDAANADELTAAIEAAAGLNVEIITGEREADWAFQGVTTDPALADTALLLLDVGGGSTEFIVGQGTQKHFRDSFPLGTVRLMEHLPPSDPPVADELEACRNWLRAFLHTEVRPKLEPVMNQKAKAGARLQLVGTGGTTTILARMEARLDDYDRRRIEATRLTHTQVARHTEKLWGLPLSERRKIIGLPPNRADVMLMGAVIYEAIMREFGFGELRVSTRGLRYAVLLDGT